MNPKPFFLPQAALTFPHLKSFPVGSSGGPSGLRAAHILQMVRSNAKDRVLEALAAFCSALAEQ